MERSLHADWRSRVIVNPKNAKLPEIKIEKVARVPISDLKDGMVAEVEGNIVGVSIGSHEDARLTVNAVLKDGGGEVDGIFTGNKAKDFLGVKEIPADVDAATVLELKRDELFGRKIVVRGSARKSKSTGKMEVVVERVI